MKTSKFSRDNLQHICKISFDGDVIFYENADFLVFITIVFVYAVRYKIRITGLTIMFNHFHILAYASRERNLNLFHQQVCSLFVRYYNNRDGKIKISLKKGANISQKYNDQQKKTTYLYTADNAVEKKYCISASEYPWTFFENVTYTQTVPNSRQLTLAKAIVRDAVKASKPLTYQFFRHFEDTLTATEKRDLKNFILSLYVKIDSSDLKHLFGDAEALLHYSESFRGSDYQVDDDVTVENYKHYSELARLLRKKKLWGNDSVIHDPTFDSYGLISDCAHLTPATLKEISRFLHFPIEIIVEIANRRF